MTTATPIERVLGAVRRLDGAPPVTRSVALADDRLEPVLQRADRAERNAAPEG